MSYPAGLHWTEIDKLWLALVHPNNFLWNADADMPSASLLHSMVLLHNLWRQLKHKHTLLSEASLFL